MLLVESAQSMANRLESTCAEGTGLLKELDGLPYVKAKLTGATEAETSSLIEAHRINSPYIITDTGFQAKFVEKAKYAKGKPLSWSAIASAVLWFDPNSLIHGVFMANLGDGRVRLPRALTGFIEASDIREAASGGVKNNPLDPTGKIRAIGYDENVYGNVPYPRTEFTAGRVTGYFNLDLGLLAGYGFDPSAHDLLVALALLKVRRFLSGGLRLRTACDFGLKGEMRLTPAYEIPSEKELLQEVQRQIKNCTQAGLFASPAVTEITTKVVLKEDKQKAASAGGATDAGHSS
jgi:CRISPR-associated protein Csb1